MTDGVYRHCLGAALTLRHGVVPLHACAQLPTAQRTSGLLHVFRVVTGARLHGPLLLFSLDPPLHVPEFDAERCARHGRIQAGRVSP